MLSIKGFDTISIVKPLKRPFADWVDDRVIPAVRYFMEDHPAITSMTIAGLWGGFRFGVRGEWLWFVGVAVMEVIFAVYLAIGWDARRRERRLEELKANHICLHCGYDMRATPERCSECGRWANEEVKVPVESFRTAEFLGEFMVAHPVFAMIIVMEVIVSVPLLMRGEDSWFVLAFGLIDLFIGVWILLDWETARRQENREDEPRPPTNDVDHP